MQRPNFFIIGAPKCGTTSLAAWLADHPNIYMSPVKEPHFFNTDLQYINTPSPFEYDRLFRATTHMHKVIGEASVFYLYSRDAIPRIEQEIPRARYIVCIRNPVDMAYSLHEQQLFSGDEHLNDFGEAWRLSEQRVQGQVVSHWCREPKLIAYGQVCRLGEQIERLYSNVHRDRVLLLVLDDVKKNPRREYLRVLSFLGIPDDGRQSFPAKNAAKELRWFWLRRGVQTVNRVRRRFGIPRLGTGLASVIEEFNTKTRPRVPMPPELRKKLIGYFREDIRRLEYLLERDLSEWLDEKSRIDTVLSSLGQNVQGRNIRVESVG